MSAREHSDNTCDRCGSVTLSLRMWLSQREGEPDRMLCTSCSLEYAVEQGHEDIAAEIAETMGPGQEGP